MNWRAREGVCFASKQAGVGRVPEYREVPARLLWVKPLLGNYLVVLEGLACSNDASDYTSGKCFTYW